MRIYRDKLSLDDGKKKALAAFKKRAAISREEVDQSMYFLRASGIPCTYYYCFSCGAVSDILNFEHKVRQRGWCAECQAIKDSGIVVKSGKKSV